MDHSRRAFLRASTIGAASASLSLPCLDAARAQFDPSQYSPSRVENKATTKILGPDLDIRKFVSFFQDKGAPFGPFLVKVSSHAQPIYATKYSPNGGDYPIVFYNASIGTRPPFLPLGDVALLDGVGTPIDRGTLLFAPSRDVPDALAHPIDFDWVLDDHGSRAHDNLIYWKPRAPQGYRAMGLCFTNGVKPNPAFYWCVNERYTERAGTRTYWSDKGTHWSHNGNLDAPTIPPDTPPPQPNQMYLVPETYTNPEANMPLWLIKAHQLVYRGLDHNPKYPGLREKVPNYDSMDEDGTNLERGLSALAVVPYTAIPDGFVSQAKDSPFYFVAVEPYWHCFYAGRAPSTGYIADRLSVGTRKQDTQSFKQTTSMTVSAESGVELKGVSAKISASFTQAFEVGHDHIEEQSKNEEKERRFDLPTDRQVWLWQRSKLISVYRSDGSLVSSVDYKLNQTTYTSAPEDKSKREDE